MKLPFYALFLSMSLAIVVLVIIGHMA